MSTDFAEQTRQAKATALAGAARTYQIQAAERAQRHGRHNGEDPSRLVCLERQVAELAQRVAALEARPPVTAPQPPRPPHWQGGPEPATPVAPCDSDTPTDVTAATVTPGAPLRQAIAAVLATRPSATGKDCLTALAAAGYRPLPSVRTVRWHLAALRGNERGNAEMVSDSERQ
jgi:hypothetical protein